LVAAAGLGTLLGRHLFAGKRLIAVSKCPSRMCWRGIEAQMTREGAQRINAGQDRADFTIDNRDGRYVGGRVDDVTHRILPWRFALRQKELKTETYTVRNNNRSLRAVVASWFRRLIGRRSCWRLVRFQILPY